MTPIPPMTTKIVNMVKKRPVSALGIRKETQSVSAMELDWVMFPMPKDAVTAKRAKANPKNLPISLRRNALRQVYMGPPTVSPLSFLLRYFTDSFVAMPTKLVATIQNKAPGPPNTMAEATPMIFPMPRVVASSVVKAAKEEIFPLPPAPLSIPKAHFRANFRFLRGRNFSRSIR